MQRMHQSYKYMKAQQKKLSGCASNSLAHEDLGHFEEAHHWNIQAKFYNENSHQYMKVTTQETLYHEDRGATLKHKCGKRIVTLSLLSFSLIFWAFSFLWPLLSFFIWASLASFIFHKVRSLIPTCGGIIVSIILSSLGQCSNNDDHHTFIFLQLKNYNSILRTKYDSM